MMMMMMIINYLFSLPIMALNYFSYLFYCFVSVYNVFVHTVCEKLLQTFIYLLNTKV